MAPLEFHNITRSDPLVFTEWIGEHDRISNIYSCYHVSLPNWEIGAFFANLATKHLSIFSSRSTHCKMSLSVRTRPKKLPLSDGVLRFSKFGKLDALSHLTPPGQETGRSRFSLPSLLDQSLPGEFGVHLCIFAHRAMRAGRPGTAAIMLGDDFSKQRLIPSARGF